MLARISLSIRSAGALQVSWLHYLVFMPAFEVVCVLRSDLLVVGSYVLHDLGQVLTFGCVNVHLHA